MGVFVELFGNDSSALIGHIWLWFSVMTSYYTIFIENLLFRGRIGIMTKLILIPNTIQFFQCISSILGINHYPNSIYVGENLTRVLFAGVVGGFTMIAHFLYLAATMQNNDNKNVWITRFGLIYCYGVIYIVYSIIVLCLIYGGGGDVSGLANNIFALVLLIEFGMSIYYFYKLWRLAVNKSPCFNVLNSIQYSTTKQDRLSTRFLFLLIADILFVVFLVGGDVS